MLILRKVAITGGLSCGKSTVLELFRRKGAYVISADDIVHQLLSANSPIKKELTTLLGEEVLHGTSLNREKIAKEIFNKKETLKALENLLHPAVLEEMEKKYNKVKHQKYPFFVAEIPLLYEIEKAHLFDTVIAVTAKKEVAQKRFQEKTHYPAEEFEKRMTHQLPISEKSARADFAIHNNGNTKELEQQVHQIYQQLTQEYNERRF